METPSPFEADSHIKLVRRIALGIAAGRQFIGHYLATSDPNLGEGKLRGSQIPEKFMDIPDYPPLHDDTV